MSPMIAFLLGMAVASAFPVARESAMNGSPWLLLLGGLSAFFPDWLSGVFRRSREMPDMCFSPDPHAPTAQSIADALETAMSACLREGRIIRLQLNSIAAAPGEWLEYRITFNPKTRSLGVAVPGSINITEHSLPAPFHTTAPATASIEAGGDETLRMVPHMDGSVTVSHAMPAAAARWSHSLLCAGLLSLVAAQFVSPAAAVIIFTAYVAHLLVDQLGHESCIWLRRPVPGLRWLPLPGPALDACILVVCTVIALAGLRG